VAQVAIQQGRAAAANIVRSLRGQPHQQFRYRDLGLMATIGRQAAVAEIGRLHLSGFVAWLVWALVHIVNLVGFDNRVLVLWQWAWAYFTFRRGARLITGPLPAHTATAVDPALAERPERA
jgi:NADH dehydrogenase